jgi:hypothetical protein
MEIAQFKRMYALIDIWLKLLWEEISLPWAVLAT